MVLVVGCKNFTVVEAAECRALDMIEVRGMNLGLLDY